MKRAIRWAVLIGVSVLPIGASVRADPPEERTSMLRELKTRNPAPIDRSVIAGEGPIPVILLAELGCDETIYTDFSKRHAGRFTIHTVVLPGAAKDSKAPPLDRGQIREPEWLVNAADAVRDYARAQKLDRPVVIGHGLGGTVAYLLAIREPELARAYVVLNALPAPSVGGPGRIPLKEQRATEVDKLDRAAILAMTPASWTNRARSIVPLQTPDFKRAETIIGSLSSTPIGSVKRYSLEPLYLDMRDDLDGTTTPILVMAMLPDWIKEADRRGFRTAFQNAGFNRPNMRIEVLEGVRQWAILDDPDRFDPPLLAFLGLEAAPASDEKKPGSALDPSKPADPKQEATPAPSGEEKK
ncbi:MAG: alpha/beta hydrolase [Phycisphaerae bacterium]|nr:alpha/beta hydrolase [Phycisphaerae bacterium]